MQISHTLLFLKFRSCVSGTFSHTHKVLLPCLSTCGKRTFRNDTSGLRYEKDRRAAKGKVALFLSPAYGCRSAFYVFYLSDKHCADLHHQNCAEPLRLHQTVFSRIFLINRAIVIRDRIDRMKDPRYTHISGFLSVIRIYVPMIIFYTKTVQPKRAALKMVCKLFISQKLLQRIRCTFHYEPSVPRYRPYRKTRIARTDPRVWIRIERSGFRPQLSCKKSIV